MGSSVLQQNLIYIYKQNDAIIRYGQFLASRMSRELQDLVVFGNKVFMLDFRRWGIQQLRDKNNGCGMAARGGEQLQ